MIRSFPPKLGLSAAVLIRLSLIGPLGLVCNCSCHLHSKIVAAAQLTLLADNAPLVCTAGDKPLMPEVGDNSLETPDIDDEDDSDEDEDDGISNPSPSR
jgi:hypothetical protein